MKNLKHKLYNQNNDETINKIRKQIGNQVDKQVNKQLFDKLVDKFYMEIKNNMMRTLDNEES